MGHYVLTAGVPDLKKKKNQTKKTKICKFKNVLPVFRQFDMQRITLEELKHILFYAFRDHLTMKDIENIIINEEESLKENSGNCQTEFEGGEPKSPSRRYTRALIHTRTRARAQDTYSRELVCRRRVFCCAAREKIIHNVR